MADQWTCSASVDIGAFVLNSKFFQNRPDLTTDSTHVSVIQKLEKIVKVK
jgi:hypothetical protein